MNFLILKKEVDQSVLRQGFTIPVDFQDVFYEQIGFHLEPGKAIPIQIMIDGTPYDVSLNNLGFNREKFQGHKEILQVRYGTQSPIAIALRNKYPEIWSAVTAHMASGSSHHLSIENKGYLAVYATSTPKSFLIDCIQPDEVIEDVAALRSVDEWTAETLIDHSAHIEVKSSLKKVRKLDRTIGENLKLIYGYHCQICGQFIGSSYGSTIIHAHHIDYFTKSLNNDAKNIMIVCPNHHAIIHDMNPIFDKKSKIYTYPNGYKEGLVLNKHL